MGIAADTPRPDLRPLLHDEGGRERHRAVDGVPRRAPPRRRDRGAVDAGRTARRSACSCRRHDAGWRAIMEAMGKPTAIRLVLIVAAVATSGCALLHARTPQPGPGLEAPAPPAHDVPPPNVVASEPTPPSPPAAAPEPAPAEPASASPAPRPPAASPPAPAAAAPDTAPETTPPAAAPTLQTTPDVGAAVQRVRALIDRASARSRPGELSGAERGRQDAVTTRPAGSSSRPKPRSASATSPTPGSSPTRPRHWRRNSGSRQLVRR